MRHPLRERLNAGFIIIAATILGIMGIMGAIAASVLVPLALLKYLLTGDV